MPQDIGAIRSAVLPNSGRDLNLPKGPASDGREPRLGFNRLSRRDFAGRSNRAGPRDLRLVKPGFENFISGGPNDDRRGASDYGVSQRGNFLPACVHGLSPDAANSAPVSGLPAANRIRHCGTPTSLPRRRAKRFMTGLLPAASTASRNGNYCFFLRSQFRGGDIEFPESSAPKNAMTAGGQRSDPALRAENRHEGMVASRTGAGQAANTGWSL
jgi:hypothetical protein